MYLRPTSCGGVNGTDVHGSPSLAADQPDHRGGDNQSTREDHIVYDSMSTVERERRDNRRVFGNFLSCTCGDSKDTLRVKVAKEDREREKRDFRKNRRSIAMPFALVTQSTTDNGSPEWKVEEEDGFLELTWEPPNQVYKWRSKQVDSEEKLRIDC